VTVFVVAAGWGAVSGAAVAVGGGRTGAALLPAAVTGLLIAVLLALACHGVVALALRGRRPAVPGQPVLRDPRDVAVLARAGAQARLVVRIWPVLGVLGEPADPAPVLERTLVELRAVLAERRRLRTMYPRVLVAVRALPGRPGAELDARQPLLVERIRDCDADVRRRLHRLALLADACLAYLSHRDAVERARRLVAEVDEVLGGSVVRRRPDAGSYYTVGHFGVGDFGVGDFGAGQFAAGGFGAADFADDDLALLAERTTAIVQAYRELSS
jgi:hypothetical protein